MKSISFQNAFLWAGVLGASAVALGAFGSHAFFKHWDARTIEIFQTASDYHFYHTLALLSVGIWRLQRRGRSFSFWISRFFIIGTLIFSGSLYLLCLTQQKWLGAITPLGGISLMLAWILCIKQSFQS